MARGRLLEEAERCPRKERQMRQADIAVEDFIRLL